jgi:hypothetical protein
MAETPDGKTESTAELLYAAALAFRDVEVPCYACSGMGKRTYGTTSTWHCGIGGATPTVAVCDRCWGSGDQGKPWPSWRSASPAPDLSALWALVDSWHADAKVMNEIAHFRDDPYDDVAFVNRNEANRLIACACSLAALLPPRAEGQQ